MTGEATAAVPGRARTAAAVLLTALVALTTTATARANGLFELEREAALDPLDHSRMVLRYAGNGGGLFYTHDGGDTWRTLCFDAIDAYQGAGGYGGALQWLPDGGLFVGDLDSLRHDDGSGCGWSSIERFGGKSVTALARDPDDPAVLFAIAVQYAGSEANSQLLRRDAEGRWELLDEVPAHVADLAVAGRDAAPPRIYQLLQHVVTGGSDGGGPNPRAEYTLRVSDTLGERWTEHALGEVDGIAMRIEAVDPRDPDRILVSVERMLEPDTLRISQDAGASFEDWLAIPRVGGVAVAPDGRVWVGDAGSTYGGEPGGLYAAAGLDRMPNLVHDAHAVHCLAYVPEHESLLLCELNRAGFVDVDTLAFEERFSIEKLGEVLECPGQDRCAECLVLGRWCSPGYYPDAPICNSCDFCQPACMPSDAAVPWAGATDATVHASIDAATTLDAASPANPVEPHPAHRLKAGDGCGCRAPGDNPSSPLPWMLAVLWLRRRSTTPTPARLRGPECFRRPRVGATARSAWRRRPSAGRRVPARPGRSRR